MPRFKASNHKTWGESSPPLTPQPTNGSACAVCMKNGSKDSLHHFLFYCNRRRLATLREKAPLRKVAAAIVRCCRKHNPLGNIKPLGEWNDDDGAGYVNLLLGGQHGGASAGPQTPMSAIRPKDRKLFDRVFCGRGWGRAKLRLAEAALRATARFLNGAMPARSRYLWASLREDDDESAQHGDSLGPSHDEG